MKIAIVGFGVEGQATYDFFSKDGHEITICNQDANISAPDGVASKLGDGYLDNLDQFDLIVRTAGMHPHVILDKNPGVANKITTHINEFLHVSPTKNIIGVTGTKGKGTTSTLITKMLEAAGKDVKLGGNIGIPPLTFLDELTAESWVVLELSSFQLIDLKTSPHIGVCLMVVPEHLNWHADMEEYMTAKQQLFAWQLPIDIAIYFEGNENSRQITSPGQGQQIPYFAPPGATIDNGGISIDGQEVCRTNEVKLLGEHNLQNACAAVTAVWQVTKDVAAMRSVLTSFAGLPHRLELVRELNGVTYYDDSFGTTPETATVAIQAFAQPKVVILGGSDKGTDFAELAKAVQAGNVRQAVIIGETGPKLIAALEKAGFTSISLGGNSMESIVETCQHQAQPGDVVLLSTGCASFDMFKNYKDRGDQFKQYVNNLS